MPGSQETVLGLSHENSFEERAFPSDGRGTGPCPLTFERVTKRDQYSGSNTVTTGGFSSPTLCIPAFARMIATPRENIGRRAGDEHHHAFQTHGTHGGCLAAAEDPRPARRLKLSQQNALRLYQLTRNPIVP